MVFALSIRLAGAIHAYLYAYAPSNVLIRYLRNERARKWALPVSLACTIGYLAATVGLTAALNAGAPGWLNILVLVASWNAMKFVWMAVLSPVLGSVSWMRRLRLSESTEDQR